VCCTNVWEKTASVKTLVIETIETLTAETLAVGIVGNTS
jgi:hypothetical protein